jgi:hypothetical protein
VMNYRSAIIVRFLPPARSLTQRDRSDHTPK